MKLRTFVLFVVGIGVIAVTATIASYNHRNPTPSPAAIVQPSEPAIAYQARAIDVPEEQGTPPADQPNAVEPESAPVSSPALRVASAPSALSSAAAALISPTASYQERREVWQKVKEAGQLDKVINELKQRAAETPNDALLQTALGVGLMNKFPVPDFNEAAMLGLQIDQSFNAALRIDPANWEAQFEKAHSMSYWPDGAGNKSLEIIERLSNLIDQQDRLAPQSEFAKTYVLLGKQYQKTGKPDFAQATWQIGLTRFPGDSALRKLTANSSHR